MKWRGAPAILTLLCLAGCPPAGPDLPLPAARVDKASLRVPVPSLWTPREGAAPEGVIVEVFFWRIDQPRAVPVTGILEVRMYEGGDQAGDLAGKEPFHTEIYPNAVLKNSEGVGMFGVSYRMVIPWGAKPPGATKIWLVARYIPPTGPAVLSEPTSVPLRPM